ncbi:MAG: PDZ domain-containing protein [Anaerolineales bacterium]|nr:PDZ domain-containing protein [Anaerolineales bacterium]
MVTSLVVGVLRALMVGLLASAAGAGLFLSGLGIGLGWPRPAGERPPATATPAPATPAPAEAYPSEPILGLEFEALTPAVVRLESLPIADGAVIRGLAAGGLAERAGLQIGDVIQDVNGLPIDAAHGLAEVVIAMHQAGALELTIWRAGASLTVHVDLTRAGGEVQS